MVGRALGEAAAIVTTVATNWKWGFFPSDIVRQTRLPPMDVYDALVALYAHNYIVHLGDNLYRLKRV